MTTFIKWISKLPPKDRIAGLMFEDPTGECSDSYTG